MRNLTFTAKLQVKNSLTQTRQNNKKCKHQIFLTYLCWWSRWCTSKCIIHILKYFLSYLNIKKYECHLLGTGICMELVNDTIAMLLYIIILFDLQRFASHYATQFFGAVSLKKRRKKDSPKGMKNRTQEVRNP